MADLKFLRHWPKHVDPKMEPNHFVERIARAFLDLGLSDETQDFIDNNDNFVVRVMETCSPKIHTIRKRKQKIRKAGTVIRMTTEYGAESEYQFLPEVKIKSVVQMKFMWTEQNHKRTLRIKMGKKEFDAATVYAGIVVFVSPTLIKLAQNDGFNSVKTFLKYFSEDGNYELISWSDYKYTIHE